MGHPTRQHRWQAFLSLPLLLAACTGSVGDGARSAGPGGQPPPGTGSTKDPATGMPLPPVGTNPNAPDRMDPKCQAISPGPSPVRRLTRAEYDNTIRDLIGEDKKLGQDFPPEELSGSFDNHAELRSVSDLLAQRYVGAAEQIAQSVVGKLGTHLACDPGKDGEAACLDRFLDGFGARAWRRPLDTAEKDDLKKVFASGKGMGPTGFAEGIDAVVQVMILSPQFNYRLERGVAVAGAEYNRLTHHEMASRLSYLLWNTMPDAPLFEAASSGKLGTRDEVMAQAKRMLDDPRATAMIQNFASQWLQLRDLAEADKDTTAFPTFKDEYLTLFREETERFVEMVWKDDAKLDTLLGASFSALNGELASFYGVKGVTGAGFVKAMLDPTQRAGVLTQASIMAAKAGPDQSSPIHRGVFVREQLFCQPLPPAPPEANAMPPAINKTQTTKERFAAHRADPSCATCHDLIDNVGFGFENYDGMGQWRATENGKMVDATGALNGTDVDGPFKGAIELSRKLTSSKNVEQCVASHLFNFSFGRTRTPADECTEQTLFKSFSSSGGNLRELLLSLVQTDAFFFKGGVR